MPGRWEPFVRNSLNKRISTVRSEPRGGPWFSCQSLPLVLTQTLPRPSSVHFGDDDRPTPSRALKNPTLLFSILTPVTGWIQPISLRNKV